MELIHLSEICKENWKLLRNGEFASLGLCSAHAGMPLLGDRKYGAVVSEQAQDTGAASQQAQDTSAAGEQAQEADAAGTRPAKPLPLCLCACRLSLIHPRTKQKMQFTVEPSWLSAL